MEGRLHMDNAAAEIQNVDAAEESELGNDCGKEINDGESSNNSEFFFAVDDTSS